MRILVARVRFHFFRWRQTGFVRIFCKNYIWLTLRNLISEIICAFTFHSTSPPFKNTHHTTAHHEEMALFPKFSENHRRSGALVSQRRRENNLLPNLVTEIPNQFSFWKISNFLLSQFNATRFRLVLSLPDSGPGDAGDPLRVMVVLTPPYAVTLRHILTSTPDVEALIRNPFWSPFPVATTDAPKTPDHLIFV